MSVFTPDSFILQSENASPSSDQALYKLKQDQEDLGDQHLLQSVASELGDAEGAEDDSLAARSLLIHVCAESRSLEESESDILVSMEEGEQWTLRVRMSHASPNQLMIGSEDSLSISLLISPAGARKTLVTHSYWYGSF